MQELLVRGYLYQMIKTKHNIIAATIVSTALFTFMHGGAFEAGIIPVLNVFNYEPFDDRCFRIHTISFNSDYYALFGGTA